SPGEVELFTEGVVGYLVVGFLAPATMQVSNPRHGLNSLALSSASSISPAGVFSVFLTKALRMTTRCSLAGLPAIPRSASTVSFRVSTVHAMRRHTRHGIALAARQHPVAPRKPVHLAQPAAHLVPTRENSARGI